VEVGALDGLLTLVGELVRARNQIVRCNTAQEQGAFLESVQRLDVLSVELRETILKMRQGRELTRERPQPLPESSG
jgi:two-component system chemotaxis sensor kinase CheA